MACCNLSGKDKKKIGKYGFVCGFIGTLTFIICLGLSFNIVELGETAIVETYHNPSLSLDSRYDKPGYYFVGLDKHLLIFPTTTEIVKFGSESKFGILKNDTIVAERLSCWSKEGVNVYIEMSFFFNIKKDNIIPMYRAYGKGWRDSLTRYFLNIFVCTLKTKLE